MISILRRGLRLMTSSPTRLLRFTLNNTLRPYLKEEFAENFELGLWQGTVNIENLELNEKVLDKKINGPFRVVKATVGKLEMSIPWRELATKNVKVVVKDICIHLSFTERDQQDQVLFEESLEKSINKSMENSAMYNEDSDEEGEEQDLGIQSVESLFESIFSGMNISLEGITIFIENSKGNSIQIKLDSANLSSDELNEAKEKTKEWVGKKLTMFGFHVDIKSPDSLSGNIFSLPGEHAIHFKYPKESFSNLRLEADFTKGKLTGNLKKKQFEFLMEFVDSLQIPKATNSTPTFSQEEKSESEGECDDQDENCLSQLEKSISIIAPYRSSTSSLLDLSLNLKVNEIQYQFTNDLTNEYFQIHLQYLQFGYQKTAQQNIFQLLINNFALIDKESNYLVKLNEESRNQKHPIQINVATSTNAEQSIIQAEVFLDPIIVLWHEQGLAIISNYFQTNVEENNTSSSPNTTLINLTIPSLNITVHFPTLISEPASLSFVIEKFGINTTPGLQHGSSILFIEFKSFKAYHHCSKEQSKIVEIWTNDSSDNPRIEIRTSPLGGYAGNVPSFMIDLQSLFQSPMFGYYSTHCMKIATLNTNGTIDLEATKRSSTLIIDVVFPLIQIQLYTSHFDFIGALMQLFTSGNTTGSSCFMLSAGKVCLEVIDGVPMKNNLNLISSWNLSTKKQMRVEMDSLRCFQATLQPPATPKLTGSFIFLNCKDLKVLDQENSVLLRKTPTHLRMDEIFCAPFAINTGQVDGSVNDWFLSLRGLSFAANIEGWTNVISLFPSPTSSENKEPSTTKLELNIHNGSIYYQPTSNTTGTESLFIVPPRAILSINQIQLNYVAGNLNILVDELKLWLKEDFHYLRNNEIYLDFCHPNISTHLMSKCLVYVLSVDVLQIMRIVKSDGTSEIIVDLQQKSGKGNSGHTISFLLHPDSYQSLLNIIDLLHNDISNELAFVSSNQMDSDLHLKSYVGTAKAIYSYHGEKDNTRYLNFNEGDIITLLDISGHHWWKGQLNDQIGIFPRYYVQQIVPPIEVTETQLHEDYPFPESINLETNSKNETIPTQYSPGLSHQISIGMENTNNVTPAFKSQDSPTIVNNYEGKDFVEDEKKDFVLFEEENPILEDYVPRNNQLEDRWEWITDEEEIKQREKREEIKIFPQGLKVQTCVKISNVLLCIKLLGGQAWEHSQLEEHIRNSQYRANQAYEGRGDAIEVNINIPNIFLDLFDDEQSKWRIRVAVQTLSIDDHVRSSHHAKFLSFSRNQTNTVGLNAKPVISLLLERGIYGSNRSESFKFKMTVLPVRLYIDQGTMGFIFDFFTYIPPNSATPPQQRSKEKEDTMLFEYFEISAIDSVIDYKPRGSLGRVFSDFRLGNNVWAFKVMELNKAHIVLSPIRISHVKDKQILIKELLSKNFKQKQIYNYIYGTRIGQSVQIGVNIGSGVVDLIRTPIEEYHKGGNILFGIGAGASSFVQKITVELLNLGVSSAITMKKTLRGIDKVIGTSPSSEYQHISNYANQPENITQGAKQAASSIANSIHNSINAISEGGIWKVPSAIIQPAIGGLSAISHLTLGLRNMVDKRELENAKEKYKMPNN